MTTRAISADTTRLAALEDCEHKIQSAFRRGLLATCDIAKELNKIFSQELYLLKAETFTEYVTDELRIDPRTYRRIINVSHTVAQLQDAGLALPANESQAAELSRLDPDKRASVWSELLALQAEDPEKKLTLDDVKIAVERVEEVQVLVPRRKEEIEVDMDNGDMPPEKKVKGSVVPSVAAIVLTEKGEAALERIRRICGQEIAEGIETGTTPLDEREIRQWADQDDDLMRALVHYVTDRHWSVSKAISFESKEVEDRTTVWSLILIAKARGGRAVINYDGNKITVETR